MGKKSKKKSKNKTAVKQPSVEPASTSATSTADNPAPPPGVSCWICLEEDRDETGQPLLRNCSCRGDSGFVHLSCIVKFAERKTEEFGDKIDYERMKPWFRCPTCHQEYRRALRMGLADAMLSFTKRSYPCHPSIDLPCDPYRYAEALLVKLGAIQSMEEDGKSEDRARGKELGLELLSVTETMKKYRGQISGGSQIVHIENHAHNHLGMFAVREIVSGSVGKDKGLRSAIKHFEKSRDLCQSIGDSGGVVNAEAKIDQAKTMFGDSSNVKTNINFHRDQYKQNPNKTSGMSLVLALIREKDYYAIECERILADVVSNSRRVHGANHNDTVWVMKFMEDVTLRRVVLLSKGTGVQYQHVRYEDDGDACVVKGPLATPRNADTEKTFTVGTNDLVITPRTPVICHGLKDADHLNGKIGEVRKLSKTQSYEVHFEDTNLKPTLVKRENVRVLFELPGK